MRINLKPPMAIPRGVVPTPTLTPTLTGSETATFTPTVTVVNYALGKPATQSSNFEGSAASRAVDGITDGDIANASVAITNAESGAWWQLDLGAVQPIGTVNLFARTDCCAAQNLMLLVSDEPITSTVLDEAKLQAGVDEFPVTGQMGRPSALAVNRSGRYLRVQAQGNEALSLAEVQVLSPQIGGTPTSTPTATVTAIPTEPTPEPLRHAWYRYDGDGNMVWGRVNDVTTFYPGRHYNKEVSGGTVKVQKFYFAISTTLAVRTLSGSSEGFDPATQKFSSSSSTDMLQWILSDHLNSTSVTANADGTWNSTIQYTAFGKVRAMKGVTATRYRYTSQLAQDVVGLDFYIARWYDSEIGHFLTPDSIIPNRGDCQAFDRYSYVNNSPIIFNDPTGYDADCGLGDYFCANGKPKNISYSQYKASHPDYSDYIDSELKSFGVTVNGGSRKNRAYLVFSLQVLDKAFYGISKFTKGIVVNFASQDKGYFGRTNFYSISFFSASNTHNPFQNMFHEIAHLINYRSRNYFTNALSSKRINNKEGKYVMGGPQKEYDRNSLGYAEDRIDYGFDKDIQAQQHPRSMDADGNTPDEEWADLAANYVIGNFDKSSYGITRENWVRDVIYFYNYDE